MGNEQMSDDDVLRFAPPEIRRLWKRVVSIDQKITEMMTAIRNLETLIKSQGGPR